MDQDNPLLDHERLLVYTMLAIYGGGGGDSNWLPRVRLARLPVFKTGAFNHSATPP